MSSADITPGAAGREACRPPFSSLPDSPDSAVDPGTLSWYYTDKTCNRSTSQVSRGIRHWLRDMQAGDPRTPDRVAECGWFVVGENVEIRSRPACVYVAQFIVCGRPWLEPVCSAKIRTRKAAELQTLIAAHSARAAD